MFTHTSPRSRRCSTWNRGGCRPRTWHPGGHDGSPAAFFARIQALSQEKDPLSLRPGVERAENGEEASRALKKTGATGRACAWKGVHEPCEGACEPAAPEQRGGERPLSAVPTAVWRLQGPILVNSETFVRRIRVFTGVFPALWSPLPPAGRPGLVMGPAFGARRVCRGLRGASWALDGGKVKPQTRAQPPRVSVPPPFQRLGGDSSWDAPANRPRAGPCRRSRSRR